MGWEWTWPKSFPAQGSKKFPEEATPLLSCHRDLMVIAEKIGKKMVKMPWLACVRAGIQFPGLQKQNNKNNDSCNEPWDPHLNNRISHCTFELSCNQTRDVLLRNTFTTKSFILCLKTEFLAYFSLRDLQCCSCHVEIYKGIISYSHYLKIVF